LLSIFVRQQDQVGHLEQDNGAHRLRVVLNMEINDRFCGALFWDQGTDLYLMMLSHVKLPHFLLDEMESTVKDRSFYNLFQYQMMSAQTVIDIS
jgi:hypothetical protein